MVKKPFLIVIDGPIGSGKSTTAKLLHKKISNTALIPLDRLKYFLSDCKMASVLHLDIASKIGRAMVKEYLKNKINVIVEKAFTREVFLREFVKGFNKKSRLFIYQLHAPEKIREVRVKQRPLLSYSKKRLTKEKIKRNTRHFNEFRFKNAREFDTGKLSTHKIVKEIMKVVK